MKEVHPFKTALSSPLHLSLFHKEIQDSFYSETRLQISILMSG